MYFTSMYKLRWWLGPRTSWLFRRFRTGICVLTLAVSALLLGGCSGPYQTGSPSQRMDAWVNDTGFGQQIGTLTADNQRISEVIRLKNGTGAIHADCSLLVSDAEAANGNLPTPNHQVSLLLYSAYGLEGEAGTNCYNAGSTNQVLLAKSKAERTKAIAEIQSSLKAIEQITKSTVSTTTTTNPNSGSIFG